MRGKNGALALVLGTAVAALCTNGCKKSAEQERKEYQQTELHSAEKINEAEKKALDDNGDYFTAVRREQLDLRARIQEEIDDIDKKLADLKVDAKKDGGFVVDPRSKDAAKIRTLLQRRAKLQAHMSAVEHSDERGWDLLRANVERDLAAKPGGKI
jgi:hypothetical protein